MDQSNENATQSATGESDIILPRGTLDAEAALRLAISVKRTCTAGQFSSIIIDLSATARIDAQAVTAFEDLEVELGNRGVILRLQSADEAATHLLEMMAASPTLWKAAA